MSVEGWRTVLVLGGIRSGKSEFAESLVADEANVRYVATSAPDEDDSEWSERIDSHRRRRPEAWATEEVGADPARLTELVAAAGPDETLVVDDLGGWVSALLTGDPTTAIADLAGALGDCRAQVVVVSPEVGLSLVPTTDLGRAFADTLGTANQAVAFACDAVILVVAGQPTWLKNTVAKPREEPLPEVLTPTVAETPTNGAEPAAGDALTAPTMALPMVATGLVIQPGMDLPMPDEHAGPSASDRLATLDVAGAGLGALERVVTFAAATQGTGSPVPWRSVRVLLLQGDHDGGAAAGNAPGESARRADLALSLIHI